jgi:fused signal recognition particle receptor
MLDRLLGREGQEENQARIEDGLTRTRKGFLDRLAGVLGPVDITDETWEELEAQLIVSDVGAATATEVIEELRKAARGAGVRRADELPSVLGAVLIECLDGSHGGDRPYQIGEGVGPWIVLVVGVNGSGKTTSIAKLAAWHVARDRAVLMVVADTFRAAAAEQLEAWGERISVPVFSGSSGGDPAAVVYDALSSRQGKASDVVIIDTAGRLHTQRNLMSELEKVQRVTSRAHEGAPHETLLVLDATTGQNGLLQARAFTSAVDVDGLVMAKLDSSAKGGVALAVVRELGVPIRYVGTGEGVDDFALFDPESYVAGLIGSSPMAPLQP